MTDYIVIRGFGAISPLGLGPADMAKAYQEGKPAFQYKIFNGELAPVGALNPAAEAAINNLAQEKRAYQGLDRSVLMAIHAGRQAVAQAGWQQENSLAINLGSSRGATGLFEEYLQAFGQTGTVPVQTSPVTTLGNISSWLAQDLSAQGPVISHSVTCSTGLQALANGVAWLKAGMARKFLAGAAEAPLTPFTVAQMKALGIYATGESNFPCRPHNPEKKNTFVLGEGAAVFALEKISDQELHAGNPAQIIIEAIGFGFEKINSKTGISPEGYNFQSAIQDAFTYFEAPPQVDLIIMHAPGTVAGDAAELNALRNIFGPDHLPPITSNKWLLGHTLGASATLSLGYAVHILETQHYLNIPGTNHLPQPKPGSIKRILITAAGFGGNAAALLVRTAA